MKIIFGQTLQSIGVFTSLILLFSCSKINDAYSDLTTCECVETDYKNDEVTSTYTYTTPNLFGCDSEEFTDSYIIGDNTFKTILKCD